MSVRKHSKQSKQSGVLAVEAALTYPLFLIVIVTIVNLLNIYYTQAVMQQAIQHTANRIAEYGYAVKAVNGLDAFTLEQETSAKTAMLQQAFAGMGQSAAAAVEPLSSGLRIDRLDEVIDSFGQFGQHADTLVQTLQTVDEDDIVDVFVAALADGVAEGIIRELTMQTLREMKVDMSRIPEEDMWFESSLFAAADSRNITITVTYAYKNPLMLKLFDKIWLRQTVTVRPWIGGKEDGLWKKGE